MIHKNRVIIDTPFYQKKIISYALIVYAINTNRCIIVQRKHSVEFLIIICGSYRKSYLPLLLKCITQQELNILNVMLTLTQEQFNNYLIDIGLDMTDLTYAYTRFVDSHMIIQHYIKHYKNNVLLNWTWPKGRLNVEDNETGYDCALREFKEEVEIDLPAALYISSNHINCDLIKTINNKLIETRCWLYIIADEIKLPPLVNHKEVSQRQWIDLDMALQLTNHVSIYNELMEHIQILKND
jgi:ADP-ribose pyrophosphatase YjhB (NUDIX family)